jgi:hypothetical protein
MFLCSYLSASSLSLVYVYLSFSSTRRSIVSHVFLFVLPSFSAVSMASSDLGAAAPVFGLDTVQLGGHASPPRLCPSPPSSSRDSLPRSHTSPPWPCPCLPAPVALVTYPVRARASPPRSRSSPLRSSRVRRLLVLSSWELQRKPGDLPSSRELQDKPEGCVLTGMQRRHVARMAANAVGREGTARLERCEFFDGGRHTRLSCRARARPTAGYGRARRQSSNVKVPCSLSPVAFLVAGGRAGVAAELAIVNSSWSTGGGVCRRQPSGRKPPLCTS